MYFKLSDTSADWSEPVPFRGEQGAQGVAGAKGETGPRGPQGIQGEKGQKGDKGSITVVLGSSPPASAEEGTIWVPTGV